MKQLFSAILLVLTFYSCSLAPRFEVKGNVKDAKGKTVYFEVAALDKTQILDSAKLGSSGSFSFKAAATEYPEFYRLRLEQQVINLVVDSTETITFTADAATFESGYKVEGSEQCEQMRILNQTATTVKRALMDLDGKRTAGKISQEEFTTKLNEARDQYKQAAMPVIMSNTGSPVAYFALFQRIFGYLIYDLTNKHDVKLFGAVATAFNAYYPSWPRSVNLYGMTLKAMKGLKEGAGSQAEFDLDALIKSSYFEIELHDYKGKLQKLTEVAKGKVVLVCFTAFKTDFSPGLNIMLNELYEKHNKRGFDIYQVAFDADEHFWKVGASNLPWVAVRDPQGEYSKQLGQWNVQKLPTLFILNKEGDVVKRVEEINKLGADIEKYL